MTVERTHAGHQTRYEISDSAGFACALTYTADPQEPATWKLLLPGPDGTEDLYGTQRFAEPDAARLQAWLTALVGSDRAAELAEAVDAAPPLPAAWRPRGEKPMERSKTTRAVVATAFGGPEVLSVIETPVGPPRPGEALIEVRAAGTNPVDYKQYSGAMGRDPARLPMRLGSEAAGVVTEVADGTKGPGGGIHVGDEVVAYRIAGGYAADLVVAASSVVPKPTTLSFEQASGMMLTGATAVHALSVVRAGAGDTVLINGAAGGVGLMAVQLAAAAGARVIGTASQSSHALLREFGAEPVTYGPGLKERIRTLAPEGVDAAVDAVGGDEALDTSLAVVSERDRIVTLIASRRAFDSGIKVIGGAPGADPGTEIRAEARVKLARLAEDGKLRVVVAAAFPLAEVAAAHRALATGHTHGKIVLVP